jgi:hypothetical protein
MYNRCVMNTQVFRLYWLQESGCDAGTPISAGELPPAVRDRVVALAAGEAGEIAVRLPFFDRKDSRRQDQILRALPLERAGNVIRAVLAPPAAARDLAATLALTDPAWVNTPAERHAAYFGVWQRVSLALQRWLRERVGDEYFRDLARYEDRDSAYPMIVYQASRRFHGRPRTEFTYDLEDFPECQATVASAWKMIGQSMQTVLERIEKRLYEAGRADIAHRYAPVWHQDILNAVRKKPKRLVELLSAESAVINAVIELGTQRSVDAANRFARAVTMNLRNVHGLDMRGLSIGVLEEATRALTQSDAGRGQHLLDRRMVQNRDVRAAWRPDFRIAA